MTTKQSSNIVLFAPFFSIVSVQISVRNDILEKMRRFMLWKEMLRVLKKLFSNMRVNCIRFLASDHPIKMNDEFATVLISMLTVSHN